MDKKQELMNQAVHLFSIKGFHQTSVQEIAQAAGISKGAFYKHYDSKEGILLGILKRYNEETLEKTSEPKFSSDLGKKEIFSKKLAFEIERLIENQDFFIMVFKDMPTDGNEQLTLLMQEMRDSSLELHKNSILEAFGPSVRPFLPDLVTLLEGTMKEYFITMFLENKKFSVSKLTEFISACIEAIVSRLDNMEPVLSEETSGILSLEDSLEAIEKKIKIFSKESSKYLSSLNLLREELQKEEPQSFLVEALITYLKQEKQIEKEVLLLEKII